jgi:hypothetical protein
MPTWYYRYVSNPPEVKQIVDERKIQSVNPATNYLTWYTPTRYRDVDLAQEELALPYTPTHRLGPILICTSAIWMSPSASLTLPMDSQGVGLKWPHQK